MDKQERQRLLTISNKKPPRPPVKPAAFNDSLFVDSEVRDGVVITRKGPTLAELLVSDDPDLRAYGESIESYCDQRKTINDAARAARKTLKDG